MSIAELDVAGYGGPTGGPNDRLLPPQDVHAEQSVLGGMLLSKDAIADCVETLKGVDFYRPAHELVYDAMLDLYGRGEPADAVTVADELTKRGDLARIGGQAYLHQLISSVPTAANAGYYAQIVAERAVLRRLVDAGTRIVQMGYAQSGDVEDIVNAAQAEVYAVADKRGGDDYTALGDLLEMTVDEIEHAAGRSGELTGVPTGFTDFDALTNGLHPGQMIVVAARPAVGKALALDTPLVTPSGWTTMGEVAVGDQVLGADGRPATVTRATEVMVGRPCFEVELCDGSVVVADAEHLWAVRLGAAGTELGAAGTEPGAAGTEPGGAGTELGGAGAQLAATTVEVGAVLASGVGVEVDNAMPLVVSAFGDELGRRALLGEVLAARGSVADDGSVAVRGMTPADRELIVGLGYALDRDGRFWADDDVFVDDANRMRHKALRAAQALHGVGAARRSGAARAIVAVRPIVSVPVRCIEVDNADHLYLAGESMVPTHNSTWGLDIARSAAIRHRLATVLFSLEMSRTEITMRLLSAEASIQMQSMRKGTMRDEDWTKLARTMGEVSDAPLFIDDSPNMSLMEIRAKCRRLKQRHNLKLVIIDYLQLMSSGKRVESRQQEVAEFSRALKLLAKELEVPVIAISQLNRGSEQRTDKRPQMSDLRESGCLTADTRILRADTGAQTSMGELYAEGVRDVPVWALDESLRYVRRHLTHVFPTGVRPVFRLTLASGKTVRATQNHPFLGYQGWTAVGDLRTGDRVAVPRHVPAPQDFKPWDGGQVALLAHHLSGMAPGPVAGSAAGQWLAGLGLMGVPARKRFVPDAVFHVSKRQIALFLKHLWSADGGITLNKAGDGGRVYSTSPSRRMVDDMSRLLLRFGISTRTRTTAKGSTIDIAGVDDQRRFLQEIDIHGRRSPESSELLAIVRARCGSSAGAAVSAPVWDRVRDALATSVPAPGGGAARRLGVSVSEVGGPGQSGSLGRVAELLDDAALDLDAINDVRWDTIVAVEPDGVEEVYDATVLDTHNFIANGIAVHNSIEQDADMVVLLHRESLYERESPREGEADLIIAKHRNGPTDTIVVAFQGHYSRFTNMATSF